jgi:arylsulfatase A-like enzyme
MKYREGLPKGSVVEKAVRTIDIVPTILDILDIPYKINLGGISLLPLVVGGEGADFYENIFIDEIFESKNFILKGVIKNNEWKYIFTEKSLLRNVKKLGREELYNLKNDPGERNNLIEQKPAILNAMRKELDFYKKYYSSRQISVLDKESDYEKKIQIKSLGYVQ